MNRRSFFRHLGGISAAAVVGGRVATRANTLPATSQPPTPMDDMLHQRLVVGREIWELLPRVASISATVMICGEPGTGRSFTAQILHEGSPRADTSILYVDCSVPGSVRRAWRSMRGSVVLEEVSELNASDQAHLLRRLFEGPWPDRVISTTSVPPRQLVARDLLSRRLFDRLDIIYLRLQPLRERREEILTLATHFAARAARAQNKATPNLTPAAMDRVLRYRWPGNIRELDRVMALSVARAEGGVIRADDIVIP